MILIDKFFCFDIKTGAVLIGWINLGVCFYRALSTICKTYKDPIPVTSGYTSILEYYKNMTSADPYYEMAAIFLILSVNIILLMGIQKGNKNMLIPWLIMKIVAFTLLTFFWMIVVIALLSWNEYIVGMVVLIIGMPLCTLPWYSWRCIYTLYQSYKTVERKEHELNN